jgi:Protein of unknown function (DUF3307)
MMLIFVLLAIYQVKHFVADYLLQGAWMLGKFKDGWEWVLPLAAHTAVHGAFTFFIALILMSTGWKFALYLACIDFIVHFTMDRIKASPNLMGRWKALSGKEYVNHSIVIAMSKEKTWQHDMNVIDNAKASKRLIDNNRLFWWSLGIDQLVHHMTHYYIIWRLVH